MSKGRKRRPQACPDAVLIKPASGKTFADVLKNIDEFGVTVKGVRENTNIKTDEHAICVSHDTSSSSKNRSLEEAIRMYNEFNTRLRKKLDDVMYRNAKQQHKLTNTLQEHEELMIGKLQKSTRKRLEYPLIKKIIGLENQLHRFSIMQMEASTIHKKYSCVQSSLKVESASYASTLQQLEENIQNMNIEIKCLKDAKREALHLRDITKETLMTQEAVAMNISRERDTTIINYRKQVEDRKLELERLERLIFPAIQPQPRDNFDTIEKPENQKELNNFPSADAENEMKATIVKLQNAAGVTKREDVLERFSEQRIIKERLQKVRCTVECEKTLLERTRQQLSAKVEVTKFSETEEIDLNIAELENITDYILVERLRQRKAINRKKQNQDLSNKIMHRVQKLNDVLQVFIVIPAFQINQLVDPTQILEMLIEKIKYLIADFEELKCHFSNQDKLPKNLEGLPVKNEDHSIKEEQEEERPLFPLFPIVTTPAAVQPQPSEDEDEIPSRSLLRRQAQLLVDTKSRRKGFIFKR